jgi:hypothetical protein
MVETVQVSKTLTVEIVAGGRDPHVAVDRVQGGRVRVEPNELRSLVAGLVCAAGLLAQAEAERARSSARSVERRRLRRKRVAGPGPGPVGDGDQERGE